MKLGFWSRGMPRWTNQEFARRAAEFGYQGVDLRCTKEGDDGKPVDEGNLTLNASDNEIATTVRAFADAGVEISSLLCYNNGGHSGSTTDWSAFTDDVAAHGEFARRLGTRIIRVTVGRPAEGSSWDDHLESLWGAVGSALDQVPGIGAVFENHAGSASATQLLSLAKTRGDSRLGVELSPDHCMVMQEDVIELVNEFAEQIHQVCYADRRPVQEDLGRFDGRYYYVRYETCLIGEGTVPAEKLFRALADNAYDGFVSLKWEKSASYGLELPDGDEVLPVFADLMRGFGVPGSGADAGVRS